MPSTGRGLEEVDGGEQVPDGQARRRLSRSRTSRPSGGKGMTASATLPWARVKICRYSQAQGRGQELRSRHGGQILLRMPIKHLRTVPILRSYDEGKAREFYIDWLGFTVDWEHRFEPNTPLYMQVSRAGIVLQVSEHHGDGSHGSHVRVEIK